MRSSPKTRSPGYNSVCECPRRFQQASRPGEYRGRERPDRRWTSGARLRAPCGRSPVDDDAENLEVSSRDPAGMGAVFSHSTNLRMPGFSCSFLTKDALNAVPFDPDPVSL